MFIVLELCLLQWRADDDKQLSGRIIRVKISCGYSASRPTKTGCLVFKSSGQITCEYFFFKFERTYSTALLCIISHTNIVTLANNVLDLFRGGKYLGCGNLPIPVQIKILNACFYGVVVEFNASTTCLVQV